MLKAGRPSQESRNQAATLASLGEEKGTKRINFDIPAEEFRQLKMYAAKHGLTFREIFRQHIAGLLNARS